MPVRPLLWLCFCPHPPDPLPLRGRGRLKVILCKGLRPLHPRAEPGRHRLFLWKAGSGGGLAWLVAGRPCRSGIRWGGLPSLSSASPAFSVLFCPPPPPPPPPPDPLPGGKGEIQSLFCRGLPPPAPLQSGGKRHWICFGKTVLLAFRGKFSTAGKDSNAAGDANTIGDYPCRTPTPQVQQVPHGFRLRGCKGRSPLHNITLSLPLPAGKGAGGMGERK